MANPDDDAKGRMVFRRQEEQPKVVEAPKSLLAGVTIVKTRETAVIGLDTAQQNAFNTHKAVWDYLQNIAQV